jgi:hypothetical protein
MRRSSSKGPTRMPGAKPRPSARQCGEHRRRGDRDKLERLRPSARTYILFQKIHAIKSSDGRATRLRHSQRVSPSLYGTIKEARVSSAAHG